MPFNPLVKKEDPVTLNNQGLALLEKGGVLDALALIDRAIELSPRTAQFHFNRATCLLKVRRLDEALTSARQGIELEPINALGWYTMGFIATQAEAYDAGAAALETALLGR